MGSVPITAGSGTPIRTISNSGVDGGANQQVVTLADDNGNFLGSSAIPGGNEDALLVRSMPTQVTRTGFSDAYSNTIDPTFGSVIKAGSGQSINQTGGNLVVTTGTTANSETILRALGSFAGAVRMRVRSTLSQRIANQQFFVELVDVIQDNASITINSATSVTVTFANNPFTSVNVGQYMYLGAYSGSGTFVPGRYAIASVSGQTVTYTVSGFAAGSGSCSVFGWNHNHLIYSGTTATNALWDTQRKGWNTGDTTIAINTSSSPGHVVLIQENDMQASVMDALVASNTGVQFTPRGSRIENVPDTATMVMQLRIVNGSTAPASSTTWTIGQMAISNWSPMDVAIQDTRPQAYMSAQPVQVANTPSVSVSNQPTVNLNPGNNMVGAISVGSTTKNGSFTSSTGTNSATVLKTSAGDLQALVVSNPTTATQYVKVYNATAVTLGTTAAVIDIPVAAGATVSLNTGPNGIRMTTGLAVAITGAAGLTNNTANTAGVTLAVTYV